MPRTLARAQDLARVTALLRSALDWLYCDGYYSQMRTVSVSEAKNSLSALLREIRGGASILITDRGVPVARLLSPLIGRGVPAAALDLAQQGRLTLPERQPNARWLDQPRPAPKKGRSAVTALLEERDGSR